MREGTQATGKRLDNFLWNISWRTSPLSRSHSWLHVLHSRNIVFVDLDFLHPSKLLST